MQVVLFQFAPELHTDCIHRSSQACASSFEAAEAMQEAKEAIEDVASVFQVPQIQDIARKSEICKLFPIR